MATQEWFAGATTDECFATNAVVSLARKRVSHLGDRAIAVIAVIATLRRSDALSLRR